MVQVISVTGFVGEERNDLKQLIRMSGANYSGTLSKKENTHLICCTYVAARCTINFADQKVKSIKRLWNGALPLFPNDGFTIVSSIGNACPNTCTKTFVLIANMSFTFASHDERFARITVVDGIA